MLKRFVVAIAAIAATGSVMPAAALDRLILGNKLQVSDQSGLEAKRKVTVIGKEAASDVPALSNPTLGGATLTVILNGGTSTTATYQLDAIGWQGSATRYKYKGPTGGDGDPVRAVALSRASSGNVKLKVAIKGSVGVQDVTLVPPNPGNDGGIILDVAGGDRYCVAFGAGAGGTESRDSSIQWKIVGAAAQPGCPVAGSTTTVATSSTTTTTVSNAGLLCPMDPTRTIFAGGPGTSACRQFDGDQPSCEQAFHIAGECGAASCWYDFQSDDCRGCGPQNEDQGSCTNTCIHGAPSCPGDPTRTIFAGHSGTAACQNLSFSQTLCEKAYHIDGSGQPASCYYDADGEECRGCGPNNLEQGSCQNMCPVCEGDPTRTTFAGGPFNSGCHKFDGAQASCEGAFIIGGDSGAATSCWYDTDSDECRGCGPNNQEDELCVNSCPTCLDASRQIFVGGPFSSACHIFDDSPALCEQSFHMSGECNALASCFFDYENGQCSGCGPFNQQSGACGNVCSAPICGNGVVDQTGEQCDGSEISCGTNQTCNVECQCVPCASTVVPAGGGVFGGTTSGNSNLSGSCGFGTGSSPEVVYQWTPATSGQAVIFTCSPATNFDTVLYLREGSCNGHQVSCNDDACGVGSAITPFVSAGTTYYIVVDGYAGDFGDFALTVTPASPSGAFLD